MVCPYSLARPGGVQGQVRSLAVALRARGHLVTVAAPDAAAAGHGSETVVAPDAAPAGHGSETVVAPDAAPAGHGAGDDATPAEDPAAPGGRRAAPLTVAGRLEAPELVRAGRSWSLPANGSRAPVALSPLAAARVARLVRQGAYDVVHLHEPLAPFLGYGCLLGVRTPLVATFHRSGTSRLFRVLRPAATRLLGHLAARVAVSEAAAATAAAVAPGRYDVLFNGIDVARFAGAAPWPVSGTTLLYLGRHERRKGLGVLLDAVAPLEEVTLWVAGDGPDTAELRRRHPPSERLHWLGVLTEEEKASRLSAAHVLCAPSLHGESFGVVLLEGMAAGCVVVASDIPGYRAASGGHGVLVEPGDPGAWRLALRRVVADVAAAAGSAAPAALQAARDHAGAWSIDRLAARYEAIYEAVAAASGTGRRAARVARRGQAAR